MARTALNGVVQYLIGEIRESRNSRIIRVNQVLSVNSLIRLSVEVGTRAAAVPAGGTALRDFG